MSNDREKHEAREAAHEAGVEGASKMTIEQAREAAQAVSEGEDPAEAKREAKD
jgi:hypothetical protein